MLTFKKIENLVKKIPQGKVTTYGTIAKTLKIADARIVGWAMHNNQNPLVPCHRVVFKDGSLAPGYAFGGIDIQRKKLLKEGIIFLDQNRVDLKNNFWQANLF